MNTDPTPPPPEPGDAGALQPALLEPLATALSEALATDTPARGALQARLAARAAATRHADAGKITRRQRRLVKQVLAPGVQAQPLYAAAQPQGLRPGEPVRAALVQLAPGASWHPACLAGLHAEWLVLDGDAQAELAGGLQAQPTPLELGALDYLVCTPARPVHRWRSRHGVRLFLREALLPGAPDAPPHLVRDAEAGWPAFAPGIERRVLWQHDTQAALLYRAAAGAQVPHHAHGHDEECLMVRGELFLDDLLLQPGDYQLAPAGSDHRSTVSDVGAVLYAHGDLELRFV